MPGDSSPNVLLQFRAQKNKSINHFKQTIMKKILLVDDHEVIRSGLKMYIENLLPHSLIEEAGDGDIALEKIRQGQYDLIILDINMPATDSFGLMANILAVRPGINILIFSMNAEEVYAKRYLQLGAKGYVSKNAAQADIAEAIITVLENKRYLSQSLKVLLADEQIDNKSNNPFHHLSPREFEIVQHLIRGQSSAKICQELSLHPSTVGTFKTRIFEKLHCHNIIELFALAKVHAIIESY
jgi:two-component system, NarL family, invasion response regulator UvrY